MTPNHQSIHPSRNELLLDAWRQVRQVKLHLHLARLRHRATRKALHQALELLIEKDHTIDKLRAQLDDKRSEIRRYTAKQVDPPKGQAA